MTVPHRRLQDPSPAEAGILPISFTNQAGKAQATCVLVRLSFKSPRWGFAGGGVCHECWGDTDRKPKGDCACYINDKSREAPEAEGFAPSTFQDCMKMGFLCFPVAAKRNKAQGWPLAWDVLVGTVPRAAKMS